MVETHDYKDHLIERAFRGPLPEAMVAASEFVKQNDVIPRTLQILEITPENWRVAVYYTET